MLLKNTMGGVLLIAGTAIGAAVLALPIQTAALGFTYSLTALVLCWGLMTIGALLVLEANLLIGQGTNLITMAQRTLGPVGQMLTWLSYLFLFYTLSAAYLSGAGAWVQRGLQALGLIWPHTAAAFLVLLLVSMLLISGTRFIDWCNRALMILLLGAFITLLVTTTGHLAPSLLWEQPAQLLPQSLPMMITAFGFAIIVPSLTEYLPGNARQLRNMVLIGSAFPIVLYGLWQMIILGTLPQTTLLHLLEQGHSATQLSHSLAQTLNEPTITLTATLFSIFALTTSILGVSLSLFDFLADGLNINKTLPNKGYVALLTFLPPFLLVMLYPQGFEFALSFAALFVSVMLGILPALMVWRARYHLQLTGPFQVWGGKPILILTMLCFMGIIAIELFNVWQVF